MYHGVINVYKEPGYTSHDVVARLRGILKQKKIGHTGTLDPAAEGVLPVCHPPLRSADGEGQDVSGSPSSGQGDRYPGYHRNGDGRVPGDGQ